MTNSTRKPVTRQSAKQYDETEPSETEEDTVWFRGRLPKETIRFTTVYEVPKSCPDADDGEAAQINLTEDCLAVNDTIVREDLSHENAEIILEDTALDAVSEKRPAADVPGSESHLVDTSIFQGDVLLSREDSDSEPEALNKEDSQQSVEGDKTDTLRRSVRNRGPPERLQYTQLGNPLISIVQSLFQGLSLAFTDALQESKEFGTYQEPLSQVVRSQPSPMQRDLHEFRRGECSPVANRCN